MDSNLIENQLDNDLFMENLTIDNSNNIIKIELESKWNEIEKKTQEKLNKNNESRKLNDLNEFSIMRINLNSLIHPIDDSFEFENYCNQKIKQLEKMKQSINNKAIYNKNIITFGEGQNDINKNGNNQPKSFLRIGDNEKDIEKNGKFNLNNLFSINTNSKKKLDIKKIFDLIDNNEDNNRSSIINKVNNFDNLNIIGNISEKRMANKLVEKLDKKRPTFLKEDFNIINDKNFKYINNTQKNGNMFNKYKEYNGNNTNLSNGYTFRKNLNNQNKIGIKSKIEENYNYFYSLYPNLKRNNK